MLLTAHLPLNEQGAKFPHPTGWRRLDVWTPGVNVKLGHAVMSTERCLNMFFVHLHLVISFHLLLYCWNYLNLISVVELLCVVIVFSFALGMFSELQLILETCELLQT